ncbi:hypothetical protein LAWI1_G007929, partial [Lachnellula willkommii]
MLYIDGTKRNSLSIKLLYYTESRPRSPELAIKYLEKETEYSYNTKRALGAIKSTISADNIDSLETIAYYFNKLTNASYKLFKSSLAIYLKELEYKLPKLFIAILLFKGLSSSFNAFSSRKYKEVTKNIKDIDITKLILDIISEEARLKSDTSSANRTTSNKPWCKHCCRQGHISNKCWNKYPELRQNYLKHNKSENKENSSEKTESTKAVMMSLAYNRLNDQRTSNNKIKFWR